VAATRATSGTVSSGSTEERLARIEEKLDRIISHLKI
jgi:hypothetical protein